MDSGKLGRQLEECSDGMGLIDPPLPLIFF